MKNFIIDVGTPIFIDALSKFGHVFEVKSGKEFSVNERLNYTEVILNYEDSVHKDYIANFLKSKNINGILSFSEDNRKYWYELAQNMDIFTNIKLPYILNQNKLFCRKKINSILKNKVRWDTINDFIGLGELQYFPIIIKPYIGKGSIDVCKCESIGEVYHFLKDKDISRFYVEEFIEGEEFSIEACHIKNNHIIYGVTKKIKYPGTLVESVHISNVTTLNDEQIKIMNNIYNTLEYSDTVSHTEIMISPKGIYYIESHPRLGGDLIPTLTLPKFKDNFYEKVMEISLGKAKGLELKNQMKIRFSVFPFPSKVPCTFHFSNEAKLYLDNKPEIYLTIPFVEECIITKERPMNSYGRPIGFAGEVDNLDDVESKIIEITDYCNSYIFR